jgi:hypothetical protein
MPGLVARAVRLSSWFDRLTMRTERKDLTLSLSKGEVRALVYVGKAE